MPGKLRLQIDSELVHSELKPFLELTTELSSGLELPLSVSTANFDGASIKTGPTWGPTHPVTSLGSDKLVVPEEKMADHEEQLSDEEKVRCRFNSRLNLTA